MKLTMDQVTAVVLAGGYGTRVQHLLPGVPKPMAMVAGKPFLEWVLRFLAKQGIQKAVLSTGYLSKSIEDWFRANPVPGVETRCVAEPEPLGTGGGFLNAVAASHDEPGAWLLLNGDSLVLADLRDALAALDDPAVSGAIIARAVPDASRYGTLTVGPGGGILGFAEKHPGEGLINGGIYCLRHSLLSEFPGQLPLSIEKDVFPAWIKRGIRLKAVVTNAPFLDIGTPETLPMAEAFILNNLERLT